VAVDDLKAMARDRACEILGVSEKATIREVRIAFRKKAASAHPDACPGLSSQDREKSERWFALLSRAYHKLLETS
jgi:DnaJ-class molecular chaperone